MCIYICVLYIYMCVCIAFTYLCSNLVTNGMVNLNLIQFPCSNTIPMFPMWFNIDSHLHLDRLKRETCKKTLS